MASKRQRSDPAAPAEGTDILKFDSPVEAAIYERIQSYEFRPMLHFETKLLYGLDGLLPYVSSYFSNIGWDSVPLIIHKAYREPTLEFLATFALLDGDDENSVTFQLNGKRFTMSLAKFNFHLRFECERGLEEPKYINALLSIPPEFEEEKFWAEITRGDHRYDPNESKSSAIRDPALRFMHNWIAHSFSAGEESTDIVTHQDLFFLWCMVTGRQCNAGRFLLAVCAKVRKKSQSKNRRYIAVGTYISFLATRLKALHPQAQVAAEMKEIDHDILQDMGIIYSPAPGKWEANGPEGSAFVNNSALANDSADEDDAADDYDFADKYIPSAPPIPSNMDAIASDDHLETQTVAQIDRLSACLDAQDAKLATLMLKADTLAKKLDSYETKMTAQFDRLEAHLGAQKAHFVSLEAHLNAQDAGLAAIETQMTSQPLKTHLGTRPRPSNP